MSAEAATDGVKDGAVSPSGPSGLARRSSAKLLSRLSMASNKTACSEAETAGVASPSLSMTDEMSAGSSLGKVYGAEYLDGQGSFMEEYDNVAFDLKRFSDEESFTMLVPAWRPAKDGEGRT